ncbi:putative ricin B-like lectin [Helianthus debilis subsp. tardiflorus]
MYITSICVLQINNKYSNSNIHEMDPYRHNHHHHHHEPPYPPPPHYPPPPPHTIHHHHEPPYPPPPHVELYPPPPRAPAPYTADYYPPPPPPPQGVHHHHHIPHMPPIINHHHHQKPPEKYTDNKPTVRVYCKAKTDYALTIRDGQVILAPSDPSDPHQHWIKDLKFSTRVKDEEGYPSFALVNKATGQAMKHSVGATYPVQLTEYNPDKLDESVLWTESKDLGDGYRAVRMVNNIRLNVDAFNGDKNHGGVRDGTKIVLWEWKKDGNQRWNMVPYCKISCFVGCKCLVTSDVLRYFLIVRRWSCLRVFE